MTDERFEALVKKLDGQARSNPGSYRFKVLLLAASGYLYLALVVLLIVMLLVALLLSLVNLKLFALKFMIPLAIFLWIVLKALWVKIAPPEGTELSRDQAPELFGLIDKLRLKLNAPRFHHVLIDSDFNAGVVQIPRLGLFGWPRNYLIIGLPLMKSLTVEQFKSVLAHEFGHLAGGHGRTSNWIYRQRLRWNRLINVLDATESRGRFLFMPFLRWYTPYFNAFSYPLARSNEFEADAAAARITSKRVLAEALTRVDVVAQYLSARYWPAVLERAADSPSPNFTPYGHLGGSIAAEIDPASADEWLEQALQATTSLDDTHPSLRERLDALDEEPLMAPAQPDETADRLLGAMLPEITAEYDRRWAEDISPVWEQHHREVREGREKLAELNARAARGEDLPVDDELDRAMLTDGVGGDLDEAMRLLRELRRRAPDDPGVIFNLGIRLLSRDDEEGVELVERAMSIEHQAVIVGSQALAGYYERRGDEQRSRAYSERMFSQLKAYQEGESERGQILASDRFDPHELPAVTIERITEQLRAIDNLKEVYLVRKRVVNFPEIPCYVLGFSLSGMSLLAGGRRTAALEQIRDEVEFPGETLILCLDGDNKSFRNPLKNVAESRIL